MDFLNILKDYENIETCYKKLSNYNETEFKNLYNFIKIKWSLAMNKINNNKYLNKKINYYKKNSFNKAINDFINKDIAIALFIKNIINRY